MLITPEYAALNADLHLRDEKYGAGAWRKSVDILDIIQTAGYSTILDYGCGKGSLKDALDGYDVREYDPAISGKDSAPQPAELVCCLDVLEHVEPERIDAVLADLARLTQNEMFFVVATRPSTQILQDGRNAHLIVEDADWWRDRIQQHFQIGFHGGCDKEFWGRAAPLGSVGAIRSRMAMSNDERNAHVRANCEREPLRLLDRGNHDPHDRRAVLVCFGPSLQDTLIEVAAQADDPNTDIFSVSAAHKMLQDNGIAPWAHLDCDPRAHKVSQMGDAHAQTAYWLASCVHPSYLDHVSGGRETRLWHAYNGPESQAFLNQEVDPEAHMVVGGGSVGLRAMSLLYGCGYRDIEVHGMDCSFRGDAQHAGEHHGKRKGVINVATPDGRRFDTAAALILYFRYFYKQMLWMRDADITLCGDGMLQHAIRQAS
jgi:hypothetical protein